MNKYGARTDVWDVNTLPDQTGRVILITGAYWPESIGFQTALQLALKGATVYVGARSDEKAKAGVDAYIKHSAELKGRVHPFVLDLSDLLQVKKVGEEFAKTQPRLDVLINNATGATFESALDRYGIPSLVTVNHFGPLLLTKTLLPLLKATSKKPSADVRVVMISSEAHIWFEDEKLKFDTIDDFKLSWDVEGAPAFPPPALKRYGFTKLENALVAKELQRQFDAEGSNLIAVSLHPGGVRTTTALNFMDSIGQLQFMDNGMTVEEGALTSLFAAASPEIVADKAKWKGQYIMPYGTISSKDTTKHLQNAELATNLWKTSERVIDDALAKA